MSYYTEYRKLVMLKSRTPEQKKQVERLARICSTDVDSWTDLIKESMKRRRGWRFNLEVNYMSSPLRIRNRPSWEVVISVWSRNKGERFEGFSPNVRNAFATAFKAFESQVEDWWDIDSPHGENSASYSPEELSDA